MSTRGSSLKRKVDYGLLAAIYGPLLTERQRSMLSLYCDEDYGLAEVALQMRVTKQCVNDTLNRAFDRLDQLEESLHLLKQQQALRQKLTGIRQALTDNTGEAAIKAAISHIDELLRQQEE